MEKLFSGRRRPEQKPPDCISRYLVHKTSWRGRYKRILCITPTAIHTQNPEGRLVLTNTYAFAGAGVGYFSLLQHGLVLRRKERNKNQLRK